MTLNEDNSYLAKNFAALLGLVLISWALNVGPFSLNYMILGFCWNFALHAPSLKDRTKLRKYRFSLLRFVYGLDGFICSFSSKFYLRIFLRSLPPILIAIVSFLFSSNGWFVLTLIGSFYFEVIYNFKRLRQIH